MIHVVGRGRPRSAPLKKPESKCHRTIKSSEGGSETERGRIEKLGIVKNGTDSADSGDDSEPDNPDAPDAAYEQLEARILQGAAQNSDAAQ